MLLSRLRFVLCLLLCMGFLSGNAQVNELVKQLRNNARSLSLASVKDPARGQPYEISAAGNVISFYKKTTVRKLIASLYLSKMNPSNVYIIKRSDRIMLQFIGLEDGAFRYLDMSSNSYKSLKNAIIHLPNYPWGKELQKIAQYAVFTSVPKRNMNLRCTGNAKTLKNVGVSIRALMHNGEYYNVAGGRFVVNGAVGTYLIKNVPIGAQVGVWINYPSEFSGETSDNPIPPPDRKFTMPASIAVWNRGNYRGGNTFNMNL